MATLDAIGIVVADMAATLDFYRLLGLDFPAGMEKEQHAEYETAGGFRIMWDSIELIEKITPDFTAPAGHAFALAFRCDSPRDVDALYQAIIEAGHQSVNAPYDAFWGQRYATVRDPNGYAVDLYAALA